MSLLTTLIYMPPFNGCHRLAALPPPQFSVGFEALNLILSLILLPHRRELGLGWRSSQEIKVLHVKECKRSQGLYASRSQAFHRVG